MMSNGSFEAPIVTNAFWTMACMSRSDKKHLVFLMRSAERVDRVFGENWTSTELKDNRGTHSDANIPLNILPSKFSSLINDSPITLVGRFSYSLVGQALRYRRIIPSIIVSSPALRCVQSASILANMLDMNVNIDRDLAEPKVWYNKNGEVLKYLNNEELIRCRFPIVVNSDYDIEKETVQELTEFEGLKRVENALRTWFSTPREGPLLIVGHAITLEIASKIAEKSSDYFLSQEAVSESSGKQLMAVENMQTIDHIKLGLKFPYSSTLTLGQPSLRGPLKLYQIPSLIPPLTLVQDYSNEIDS